MNCGILIQVYYTNGYVYVEVYLQIGAIGFLFDTRLYQREEKVRQLNREVRRRLHCRNMYNLARAMLEELANLLPISHRVYVLFDSWHASATLFKFCRQQRWHVIYAVKSNQRFEKKRMAPYN